MDPDQSKSSALPAVRSGLSGLEVGLLAVLCFVPSLFAGFVYDDVLLIRDNRFVQNLQYLPRAFTTHLWELEDVSSTGGDTLRYYRPLVTASYLFNWLVSAGTPWGFHLFNVAVHGLVTVLAFSALQRWTAHKGLALVLTLVFMLHPSRTESVTWIAGRTDLMMTLFMLLAVEASVRAERGRLYIGLASVSFVAALLCKETAVLLPLLLLTDATMRWHKPDRKRLLINLGVQVGVGLTYVLVRSVWYPVSPKRGLELTPDYGFMTIFAYAERVIWPWPQTFFHRPLASQDGEFVIPWALTLAGVAVTLGFCVLTAAVWKRDRVATTLLVASVAAFGPLLNFTYTGIFVTTSDHFLYLPLLLFMAGMGRAYAEPLIRALRPRATKIAVGGLLGIFFATNSVRALDYRSQRTLFQREVELFPHNPLALKSLSEAEAREGDVDEAFDLLLRASAPESTRYRLLLPLHLQVQLHFRLVGLQTARTADGDVRDLAKLYRELRALVAGRTERPQVFVGRLRLGPPLTQRLILAGHEFGGRKALAAETALLASRLGDDAGARRYLSMIDAKDIVKLPNPVNLALAYARIGDILGARRWLDSFPDFLSPNLEESLKPVRRRLSKAEQLFEEAEGSDGTTRAELRALAFVELGAYLRALLEVRTALEDVDGAPGRERAARQALLPLYAQLLVGARLDGEAFAVAREAIGEKRARAAIMKYQAGLSPRLLSLRPVDEPSGWYELSEALRRGR